MITQDEVEKAIQWTIEHADAAAQAKADRETLKSFKESLESEIMLEVTTAAALEGEELTSAAARMHALADDRYKAHLKGLHEAIRLDTKFAWLKSAAESRLEIFRTQEATKRILKV